MRQPSRASGRGRRTLRQVRCRAAQLRAMCVVRYQCALRVRAADADRTSLAEGRTEFVRALRSARHHRAADQHARLAEPGDQQRTSSVRRLVQNLGETTLGLIAPADQERSARGVRRDVAPGAPGVLHADARLRDLPADAPDSRRAAGALRQDHDRGSELRARSGQGDAVRDRSRAGHRPRRTGLGRQ